MGTQYVDDHRFLLCKGSTVTDITRAVSQPEARGRAGRPSAWS